MLSQTYYVLRSSQDGQYLAARPEADGDRFLLMFSEHHEALSYVNRFAEDYKDRLSVESQSIPALKMLLQRWGYAGFALVRDPLLPRLEFLRAT
jgi:hypothetical protein